MAINSQLNHITAAIIERSHTHRTSYLQRLNQMSERGPHRAHLSCGNQAHAYAAMGSEKELLKAEKAPNLGIVTAHNDMLSAHQPFQDFPLQIKKAALSVGATAQIAGGVPAMCDGVTQGQGGMELSLFSRDVIALAATVALSHNTFDAVAYLGVCDKIVPGLVMAAATFGHLPSIFLPAGPMTSGLSNEEKSITRQKYARGEITRKELLESEMKAYHGPGTCTFYGTANSNQMLMEFMGLHLPGSSFVNPNTPLREALTTAGTKRVLSLTHCGNAFTPVGQILSEKAFVNGIVGLMATGGSTNLVIHLTAMAKAAGIILEPQDFDKISGIVPLMARVYPNGLADVNHFHAAGGLGYIIGQLLDSGLLHDDVKTVNGDGLSSYTTEPKIIGDSLIWDQGSKTSLNEKIITPADSPFQKSGGIKYLSGNLGEGIMKISSVPSELHSITAPARVFNSQDEVKKAFTQGEFTHDTIIVVKFQGPKSNGMPELHSLTPLLSVLLGKGLKVALVTDGRMSGASGKVPSVIHLTPEAMDGGLIAKVKDGDSIKIDAKEGAINVIGSAIYDRPLETPPERDNFGLGRELFQGFRQQVGTSVQGASAIL